MTFRGQQATGFWQQELKPHDHIGFTRRFVRRCRVSYRAILVETLRVMPRLELAPGMVFGHSGTASLTPGALSSRSQFGRAAFASVRLTKGFAGENLRAGFGFSTFVIPGGFAPRAAHYHAGYALKPRRSLVASTAVVQARQLEGDINRAATRCYPAFLCPVFGCPTDKLTF